MEKGLKSVNHRIQCRAFLRGIRPQTGAENLALAPLRQCFRLFDLDQPALQVLGDGVEIACDALQRCFVLGQRLRARQPAGSRGLPPLVGVIVHVSKTAGDRASAHSLDRRLIIPVRRRAICRAADQRARSLTSENADALAPSWPR